MKLLSTSNVDGKCVLFTETKRFLRKPLARTFWEIRHIASDFYEWAEMPGCLLVYPPVESQLNLWRKKFFKP